MTEPKDRKATTIAEIEDAMDRVGDRNVTLHPDSRVTIDLESEPKERVSEEASELDILSDEIQQLFGQHHSWKECRDRLVKEFSRLESALRTARQERDELKAECERLREEIKIGCLREQQMSDRLKARG
jgi:predicted nuclease with TOPRIM domain